MEDPAHPREAGELIGRFIGAFVLLIAILWAFQWMSPHAANRGLRLGQLASGTFFAFTHGANDAQKTTGVIAQALFAHGSWRIIRTLGQRLQHGPRERGDAVLADPGALLIHQIFTTR